MSGILQRLINSWIKITHLRPWKTNRTVKKISPLQCIFNSDWPPQCEEKKFLNSTLDLLGFNVTLKSDAHNKLQGWTELEYET